MEVWWEGVRLGPGLGSETDEEMGGEMWDWLGKETKDKELGDGDGKW